MGDMHEWGRSWALSLGLGPGEGQLLMIAAGVVALLLHFLPTIIAFMRHHHNLIAIFALNFLLGWTGLGWIIAFIWSLTTTPKAPASAP